MLLGVGGEAADDGELLPRDTLRVGERRERGERGGGNEAGGHRATVRRAVRTTGPPPEFAPPLTVARTTYTPGASRDASTDARCVPGCERAVEHRRHRPPEHVDHGHVHVRGGVEPQRHLDAPRCRVRRDAETQRRRPRGRLGGDRLHVREGDAQRLRRAARVHEQRVEAAPARPAPANVADVPEAAQHDRIARRERPPGQFAGRAPADPGRVEWRAVHPPELDDLGERRLVGEIEPTPCTTPDTG